jgi:hypothetical protein
VRSDPEYRRHAKSQNAANHVLHVDDEFDDNTFE